MESVTMRSRLLGAAALAVALTVSTSAQAQPIQFFFATSGGVFTNAFTIPVVGNTVDVQVFINDTGAASSFFANAAQTQNLNTNNLRGASFRVNSSAPGIARVNAVGDVTTNPAFSFIPAGFPNVSGGTVNVSELVLGGPGVSASGTGRIFLGTLRFTGAATGTTTLSFADNDTTNQGTSLGNETSPTTNGGAILDPTPPGTPPAPGLFSNTATIIVGVPEPTSLVLVGLGVAGLSWVRRRKATALAV